MTTTTLTAPIPSKEDQIEAAALQWTPDVCPLCGDGTPGIVTRAHLVPDAWFGGKESMECPVCEVGAGLWYHASATADRTMQRVAEVES